MRRDVINCWYLMPQEWEWAGYQCGKFCWLIRHIQIMVYPTIYPYSCTLDLYLEVISFVNLFCRKFNDTWIFFCLLRCWGKFYIHVYLCLQAFFFTANIKMFLLKYQNISFAYLTICMPCNKSMIHVFMALFTKTFWLGKACVWVQYLTKGRNFN